MTEFFVGGRNYMSKTVDRIHPFGVYLGYQYFH